MADNDILSWQGVQKLWQRIKEYVHGNRLINFYGYQGKTFTAEANHEYVITRTVGSAPVVQLPTMASNGDMVTIKNFASSTFMIRGSKSGEVECQPSRTIYAVYDDDGYHGWLVYFSDNAEWSSRGAI